MNRKQRRALGRSGAGPSAGGPGASGDKFGQMFAAAAAHHASGKFAEAERGYREIVALFPTQADVQSRLGAVLMAQGKTAAALPHLERAVALKPDQFEALGALAQAYMIAGQSGPAVMAALRALELRDSAPVQTLFAHCVRTARFTADPHGRVGKMLARALAEDWAPPRELTSVAINVVMLDAAVETTVARIAAAWPTRPPAAELLAMPEVAALARNELLRRLLTCDPITDIGLERVFTAMRRTMLTLCTARQDCDEDFIAFFSAIARQCFLNEYIYALPDDEAAEAQQLRAALTEKLERGEAVPALWPVAVGAYFPLHSVPEGQKLCERSWPPQVEAVLTQQIKEPAEERRIAAEIPALTGIDDAVSRAVRAQYEENPYPRWVKNAVPQKPPSGPPFGTVPDILIAGCGTGLSLSEMSRQPNAARVLAIDLSLASLSYAKRMAQKLGLSRVEFAQADILQLGALDRAFDFIDASGVLHHMADPWQGWRILLSLLRPGGTMQVALYSDLARRNIVAARALIAERGYRATPSDIRRLREDLFATDDTLLKSLTRSGDLFTTSECRDLLFHVQEHRVTLPAIKSFLTATGTAFLGFNLEPAAMQAFERRFPGRATDLDRWHAYETEAPDTFVAMYQFQIQKPKQQA
jgi:SAM-dependent methyltransferase